MKLKLSEELKWRGLVNQTTYKDLSALDKGPITFYWGVDPSADSMTVGNMAAAMMVKLFIKYGHKPVLLVGGATGMIGDPDGKSSERELLEPKTLERNKQAIVEQYHRLFGGAELQIVDNYDWFKSMGYLQFLREVGKHVPTRQMLAREFVQNRLGEQGNGISYAEFSYVLIQAYDFLYLYEKQGVTLQVCGSDQWGNSIAGVDLIRRKTGGEAHVYSVPLVVNQATGQKFGKTETGAVWLDAAKTTPTQFYQFWINTDDNSVESYLKIFTELSKSEIETIMTEHQRRPEKRLAQTKLAQQVTTLVHGESKAKIAEAVTEIITDKKPVADANEEMIKEIRLQIAHIPAVSETASIIDGLSMTSLASSKNEARRLIEQGSIYINGQKIQRENFEPGDFQNGRLLLRRGKAYKDSALVELTDA